MQNGGGNLLLFWLCIHSTSPINLAMNSRSELVRIRWALVGILGMLGAASCRAKESVPPQATPVPTATDAAPARHAPPASDPPAQEPPGLPLLDIPHNMTLNHFSARAMLRCSANRPIVELRWQSRLYDQRIAARYFILGHICGYENDEQTGPFASFFISERPDILSAHQAAVGHFQKGERHGRWKTWFPDGTVQAELGYLAGMLDGPYRWRHDDGTTSEGVFSKGHRSGPWSAYNPNGSLRVRGNFEGGQPHGVFTYWHGNRVVSASGRFEHGQRVGRWSGSHAAGGPSFTIDYAEGKAAEITCQSSSGGPEPPVEHDVFGRDCPTTSEPPPFYLPPSPFDGKPPLHMTHEARTRPRYWALCEAGQLWACRRATVGALQTGRPSPERDRAVRGLTALCRRDAASCTALRLALDDEERALQQELNEIGCEMSDGHSCSNLAEVARGKGLWAEADAYTEKACRAKTRADWNACHNWRVKLLNASDVKGSARVDKLACNAGSVESCERVKVGVVGARVLGALKRDCSAGDGVACAEIADRYNNGRYWTSRRPDRAAGLAYQKKACRAGHSASCMTAYGGLRSSDPPPAELKSATEALVYAWETHDDSGAAELLQSLSKRHPELTQRWSTPRRARLEYTACYTRDDAARCAAAAQWLSDAGFPGEATDALRRGCRASGSPSMCQYLQTPRALPDRPVLPFEIGPPRITVVLGAAPGP